MIASGRTALASSGAISGVGFASARMSGSRAMSLTMSGLSTPPADNPRKTSAPSTMSPSARAEVGPRIAGLDRVHPLASTLIHDTFRVRDEDVFRLQPKTHQLIKTGNCGGTRARACQLDLADIFTHQRKTVENGRRGDDRSAMLVVMEDGNF